MRSFTWAEPTTSLERAAPSTFALSPLSAPCSVNTGFTTGMTSTRLPSARTTSLALSLTGVRGALPSVMGVEALVR